jgi:hypothetical protein
MSEGKTPQRERIDEVLAAWPEPERSALEWDEAAGGVMARLEAGAATTGVSDEDLLGPPLPADGDEVQGSAPMSAAASSRQRDRANLKELAKMADMAPPSSQPTSGMFGEARRASQPPPVAEGEEPKENSGLIHLAGLAEGEAKQATVAAAPAAAVANARAVHKTGSTAKSNANLRWLGGMVAAAAVAAGVFVGMRGQSSQPEAPVAFVPVPPGQVGPGAAPLNPPGAPFVAPIAATDRGVDPSTLPPADTAAAAAPALPSPRPAVAVAASGPPVTATATATAPDPKLAAVVPSAAPAPSGGDVSLQQQMQQAAGVTPGSPSTAAPATPDAPQAGAPGSVPFKPSMGAINGALGAAMPGARACLGPDDPISRATVTFQSDGSVQSVSVSGGAAGKPAEGCIRAALMKARVQPFAIPTFSAPATIRPN